MALVRAMMVDGRVGTLLGVTSATCVGRQETWAYESSELVNELVPE